MDFVKVDEKTGLHFEVLRRWNPKGHEVALIMLSNPTFTDMEPEPYLYCECQYAQDVNDAPRFIRESTKNEDEMIADLLAGRIGPELCDDASLCAHKALVRKFVRDEVQAKYRERWEGMPLKDAVMDVFIRFEKQEYLGQCHGGMLYVQDVAELLERQISEVLQACRQLIKEERLGLSGMILVPFKPEFHFPKEIGQLMAYMIEEPLGWPNGEAGGRFLAELEDAINECTDYQSGKQAFGEHNYPHVSSHLLLAFGARWLEQALAQAEADPEDKAHLLRSVNFDQLLAMLRKTLKQLNKLHKVQLKK
ncbi:MAG: hypothetical protein WCT10_05160 [Patescibacteria group bacterium]|jgi:hypothetical protein